MKVILKYSVPKKYAQTKLEIFQKLEKAGFFELISSIFFPELEKNLEIEVIHKKSLGFAARFYKKRIYFNFANPWDWGARSLVHELTHILLKEVQWESQNAYKKISSPSKQKEKDLIYEYEQSIAILTQAYFENLLALRKFEWLEFEKTFRYMKVENTGRYLFDQYKEWFIKDKKTSILKWLNSVEIR